MKSIRRYLSFRLLAGGLILLLCGDALLYLFVRNRLVANFDANLAAKSRAFASMVEQEPEGIEIEFREAFLPEYQKGRHSEYYQIWDDKKETIARSISLGEKDLVRQVGPLKSPAYYNLHLPDGRKGRAVGIRFSPHIDEEDSPGIPSRITVEMVLAQDLSTINDVLVLLAVGFLLVMLILGGGLVELIQRVVTAGLRPLTLLSKQTGKIDSALLSTRFPSTGHPIEMAPIVQELNALMDRLQLAFAKEKRLASDMAHELKTPIAELRSMVEVALKWPEDVRYSQNALNGALEVARQMNRTVTTLLDLARCETARQNIIFEPVQLQFLVLESWQPWRKKAAAADIEVDLEISDCGPQEMDKVMFTSLLANIFSNAVEHSPAGGHLRIHLQPQTEMCRLTVENEAPNLVQEDIPHLFERLWRKDTARQGDSHCGLGLALVKAYCDTLDIDVQAKLSDNGWLRMIFDIPKSFGEKNSPRRCSDQTG